MHLGNFFVAFATVYRPLSLGSPLQTRCTHTAVRNILHKRSWRHLEHGVYAEAVVIPHGTVDFCDQFAEGIEVFLLTQINLELSTEELLPPFSRGQPGAERKRVIPTFVSDSLKSSLHTHSRCHRGTSGARMVKECHTQRLFHEYCRARRQCSCGQSFVWTCP